MYLPVNIRLNTIEEHGTNRQKAVVAYFDFDGNQVIDAKEAKAYNTADIKISDKQISIKLADGRTDVFENIRYRKPDEYYKSGTIPIAVIDTYDPNLHNGWHGTEVSNTLKKYNPLLALTEFNNSLLLSANPLQRFIVMQMDKNLEFSKKVVNNKILSKIIDLLMKGNLEKTYINSFSRVKKAIDGGAKFQAVNLSSGYNASYKDINRLVSNELGVEITPDNIKDYIYQIKDVLSTKQNEKILMSSESTHKEYVKVKDILKMVEMLESFKIPVYSANCYKTGDKRLEDVFNLFALAKNVKMVEAGTQMPDGRVVHAPTVSRNSLNIDENGNRRIQDSIYYSDNRIDRGCTSYAAPMQLAKDFL